MGIVNSVVDALRGNASAANESAERSAGAYWCDDCGTRIRDVDHDGPDAPSCPDCGEEMRFERSPDSGSCAC